MLNRLEEMLNFNKHKNRTGFYALLMIGVASLIFGFALMYKGSGDNFGFFIVFLGWFLTAVYYTIFMLIISVPATEEEIEDLSTSDRIEYLIQNAASYKLSKTEVKMLKKVLKKVDENNN